MGWLAGGALVLALLPAGCALWSLGYSYDKPGVTQADRDRDANECERAAMVRSVGKSAMTEEFDRNVFDRCMTERGYKRGRAG